MKYASIEHGRHLKEAGHLNAAWSIFYKTLLEVEYQLKTAEHTALRKEQFDCLLEIGDIQQSKFHHDAANQTFETAEYIRSTYLSYLNLAPIQQVGLPKWKHDLDIIHQLEQNEQFYALVDVGKRVIDEIEALDYSQQSREHWRLLWETSETLSRAFTLIDESEKADMYHEKAEDLAFIHDFDDTSSSEK